MKYIELTPVITEKTSMLLNKHNQYVFYVNSKANKIEVCEFIKKHYKVQPIKVNILNVKGKTKLRPKKGTTNDRKKAIVYLKKEDKIESITKLFWYKDL